MSQTAQEPATEGEQEIPPFSAEPRKASCGRCGCMVLIVLLTLALLSVIILRAFYMKTIDPERMARLKKYDTEILQVPRQWKTPAPLPSKDVVEFQFGFYDKVGTIYKAFQDSLYRDWSSTSQSLFMKLRHGDAVTSAEQHTLDSFVAAMSPIIQETSATVGLPTYTANMTLYPSTTNFVSIQAFTLGCSIVALETVRKGDCASAMEIAALPIRYMHREPPAILIYEMVKVAVANISSETMASIGNQCSDPAAIARGLAILNELQSQTKPLSQQEWLITDEMGLLFRADAFGYPVNLSSQTRSSLKRQFAQIYGAEYNEWAVKHFPPEDRRHQEAKAFLASLKKRGPRAFGANELMLRLDQLLGTDLTRELIGFSPDAITADIAQPNILEAATRMNVMSAKYELTRLQFAQRLAELSGGATANDIAGITVYLQEIPADPFSSGTMLFHSDKKQFYSTGPDQDDDKLQWIYDPSNGTLSNGDLVVRGSQN